MIFKAFFLTRYESKDVEIVWSIKDNSISSHYFDNGAACFLLSSKQYLSQLGTHTDDGNEDGPTMYKRIKYTAASSASNVCVVNQSDIEHDEITGSALGPDWHNDFVLRGLAGSKSVQIEYGTEVRRVFAPERHSELIVTEFGEEEAKGLPIGGSNAFIMFFLFCRS